MRDPLRFAYLVSQYPTIGHTFILREVRGLRETGLDPQVISIRSPDRPADRLTEVERQESRLTFYVKAAGFTASMRTQLKVLISRPVGYFRGLSYALRLGGGDIAKTVRYCLYFAEAVTIGAWMERSGLRHVHTHFVSSVALIIPKIFPWTFSATIHGSDEFNDAVSFRLPEKIHDARFLIAISKYGRSQLMRLSDSGDWGKIEISRLGVDPSEFPATEFRERPQGFELICVGRLISAKAYPILLQAFEKLIRRGKLARLRIVGDGPLRASLERSASVLGISEHVVFHGALRIDQVQDLYRSADAFVLASFLEGLPVVLMEAMATGLPCVATRITGIPELIRDEIDGLLVTPSDTEELCEAIERLMEDTELRRRLASSGRERVLLEYDIRRNIKGLAEIFRKRLGS